MATITLPEAHFKSNLLSILVVLAMGLTLVAVAGFAGSDILHNVAHDGRHSAAFPCH